MKNDVNASIKKSLSHKKASINEDVPLLLPLPLTAVSSIGTSKGTGFRLQGGCLEELHAITGG
ncbi:hypothetical protein M404DRAFT_998280 [Pisolithus tinctorius Marx 270]|uniref:Uncharacterized protein n=1 Tax=Pisolithus tinctorius Marx 270 TaxID=870435 RepID=A0A0C3PF51_PISTI|nr:hypothetical protein M404DRAFT_998280 [Pisolithus tinctorius Marx 270]